MQKNRNNQNPAPLLLLLGAATVLALLAPLGWPFELFVHFRVQYAAVALALLPLLLWTRRPGYAAFAAALALFHVAPAVLNALAEPPATGCTGPSLTVVTANVRYRNEDRGRFVDWLNEHPADLVVVQEVTAAWAEELAQLESYPHRTVLVREDPYGIAVLSRGPLESAEPADFAGDGLPSLVGRLEVGGQRLMFVGLHTHWPVLPGLARARDESLREVARVVRGQDRPAIVLGDLNLTPYSPAFAGFEDAAGVRDVMDGRRWRPTWRAGFWPLALRIDHVLASAGICVERAEVGPAIGSDHRPVIARLRLPAVATP
ncbi:MAG: endonuclease/exonuclease/phosphatase family protein [Steroidobacteraceae bacterium]